MSKQQSGFTLVELVIVIVILGLLAATALPRFINVTQDARIASVNGIAGGLRSAISLAKASYLVSGSGGTSCGGTNNTVCMDGVAVAITTSGYPSAGASTAPNNGIEQAMQGTSGYAISYIATTTTIFQPNGGNATCQAAYNKTTALVTTSTGGC